MDILVTGFGPFPHVRINPTTALARQVARRLNASFRAEALVLETSYAGGLPTLRKHLTETRPKAVLMLGLAARARFIRVELFARGRSSRLHVDATGKIPAGSGAGALPARTTANPEGALASLRRQGLHVRLSPSAGRYLCDASYAVSLATAGREGVPVLFVHVPWLRPGPGRKPKGKVAAFRPATPALVAALAEIGAAMARAGR
ncbi:peptidase C15 [Bosea caraganae]|uniref:pyroglutamyl-peptidase I family protein n=1 Tax=Bosea caraganae TaxID=2763117 RepID=UPI001FE558E7|nr:peptidase C15 [Bosea caraganae]